MGFDDTEFNSDSNESFEPTDSGDKEMPEVVVEYLESFMDMHPTYIFGDQQDEHLDDKWVEIPEITYARWANLALDMCKYAVENEELNIKFVNLIDTWFKAVEKEYNEKYGSWDKRMQDGESMENIQGIERNTFFNKYLPAKAKYNSAKKRYEEARKEADKLVEKYTEKKEDYIKVEEILNRNQLSVANYLKERKILHSVGSADFYKDQPIAG